MKKNLFVLSAALLFLFSCSSDDSATENLPSENLLLKKTVEGDAVFGANVTTYTYDGNKLVNINIHDEYSNVYTYTGNLITKIEKLNVYNIGTPGEETELYSTDLFAYNSANQLIEFKTTTPYSEMERVTTYVYNSDNTVSFEQYETYPGNDPELLKTGTITMQDGEISKLQVVKEFDSFIDNYTYDTKNSIFKNVVGYDKLMVTHIGTQGSFNSSTTILGGISHNFVNNGELEYTYNASNYPITADQKFFGTVLHTYEFIYE